MRKLNWPRIVLCGFVTGVVYALMAAVLVGAFGSEFLAAASARAAGGAAKTGLGVYGATVAAGMWAMWLHAVLRPWFAKRFAAAAVAGLAWWLGATLQSLKWTFLLGIPASAWLPLAASAVPSIAAVLVGAALFGDAQPGPQMSFAEPSR